MIINSLGTKGPPLKIAGSRFDDNCPSESDTIILIITIEYICIYPLHFVAKLRMQCLIQALCCLPHRIMIPASHTQHTDSPIVIVLNNPKKQLICQKARLCCPSLWNRRLKTRYQTPWDLLTCSAALAWRAAPHRRDWAAAARTARRRARTETWKRRWSAATWAWPPG